MTADDEVFALSGPSEALALAIAGREVALADLSSDGLAVLAARVTGPKG